MKDFLKAAPVLGVMLALGLSARVAAFAYLHGDTAAMPGPAPIAAADSGCGVMAVKMPCFHHANPAGRSMASAPLQSSSAGAAGAETIAAQDPRCALRQVKMPCLQHTDTRS